MGRKHNDYADTMKLILCVSIVSALIGLAGCENGRHVVIAATGTNIGVEVSQNPATQTPQAKLGYQRTEVAIVPTNRLANDKEAEKSVHQNGAKDVADVLMELKYAGIFDFGTASGIYQRLAVGATAVSQPGAAFMFARDAKGTLDKDSAAAINEALKSISEARSLGVLRTLKPLRIAYTEMAGDASKKKAFDDGAKQEGFLDFRSVLIAPVLTPDQVQRIRKFVEENNAEIKSRLKEIDPSH